MNLLLVAHGTRKPHGVSMIGELAQRVSAQLGRPPAEPVATAFVDVLGPTPAEALRALADRPTVLVPAFLSAGYHVRVDIPAQIELARTRGFTAPISVPPALGPSPDMVRVLLDRLIESGWRSTDTVVLAAAGTSDPRACRDLRVIATQLSAMVGSRVELAFAATGTPRVADAVAQARSRGAKRVVVASYLLADGLFQDRLSNCGADAVTAPLGLHPGVVRLVASRFRRAWVRGTVAA